MNNTFSNNRNSTLRNDFTLRNDISYFGESLQFFIDIDNISRDLQDEINTKIEKAKQHYACYVLHPKGQDWSKSGVNITSTTLDVKLGENKQLTCVISAVYEDKENPVFWGDICILVDLTLYEDELKQLMLAVLIDKFF